MRVGSGPTGAVARRAFSEARISTGAFALGFGVMAYAQVAGYAASFPTHADRVQFAHSFGDSAALCGRPSPARWP